MFPPSRSSDAGNFAGGGDDADATLGSQFIQVLRLLAQVAREDDTPPPPPPPPLPRSLNPSDPSPSDDDFLRIEIDGWDNENDEEEQDVEVEVEEEEEDDEDEDDEEDVRSVEIEGHSDDDEEEENEEREEDIRRRQRRDVLRLRLRDFATRARSEGRNRILDWAEILMGLEDNSIEFRFEMAETDRYIGNPGDYVDAAEYETLLQTLAEAEGRRGAPPASKSAVEKLKMVEIKSVEESYVCAICKDGVNVGEFVKEMPCGHGYHGDCIVPWLGARNSCPVCRFELPTDDQEYEEERKKRSGAGAGAGASSGSAGGGNTSSSSNTTTSV